MKFGKYVNWRDSGFVTSFRANRFENPYEEKEKYLEKIKELVTEITPEWAGTATELVEVLQVEMQPNALSRKLNVSLERLILEYGIQYKTERGHDGRKIRLTFVGKQA